MARYCKGKIRHPTRTLQTRRRAEAGNVTVRGVHFRTPVLIRTGATILTEDNMGES